MFTLADVWHLVNSCTSAASRYLAQPTPVVEHEKAPDDERPALWLLLGEIVENIALRLLLLHHQGFDDVVDLEVVEVLQAHTTLVALEDFLGVFLEALQR